MINIDGKALPTVEQVEIIMAEWGDHTVQEFARRFNLDENVITATVESLQRLKRASSGQDSLAMSCYRNDNLESIVRCAGSRHGYL